jgi:hypothetical protein
VVDSSTNYDWIHLPLLAFTATLVLHPLASASCAVKMISTATTVTNPSAAIIAKITNVEFVSIGCKYFTKYIILIGKFERNALLMGFLYNSLSFFGDSVMDGQKLFCGKKTILQLAKTKSCPLTH